MNGIGHTFLFAVIVAVLPGAAAAENFFRWTDGAGVIHFTNIEAEVPTDQKWVQLGVDAVPTASAAPEFEPEPPAPPPPPAPLALYGSPVPPPLIGLPAYAAYAGSDECDYDGDVPYIYPGGAVVHQGHARHLRPRLAQPLISGRIRTRGTSRGHR